MSVVLFFFIILKEMKDIWKQDTVSRKKGRTYKPYARIGSDVVQNYDLQLLYKFHYTIRLYGTLKAHDFLLV